MKTTIASLLLFLLSSPLLPAQETLSLEQCRTMALRQNKELAASARQAESARYTMKSHRGNFFPDFTATGAGLYSTADGRLAIPGGYLPTFTPGAAGKPLPDGGSAYFPGIGLDYKVGLVYTAGIRVEQPLYMGGKIRAAYRMSALGKEMAEMNETLTATEVILQTDNAFAQVVKAQEMRKVAGSYRAVLAELKANVESAYKHGLKAQNDVLKVQVKLNESELSIRKADNALRLATMNLCHLIGRPLADDVRTTGGYPEVPPPGAAPQVSDVSARPEYGMLDRQVAIARQQVKLERSELLPKVGLMGAYDYMHGLEVNDQLLADNGSFSVLLNVSIPIYHFGERANKVRAAKAKLLQAELQQANMNEQMLLELAQAANNLDEARLESDLSDRSLRQAEENMKVSKSQYDVGLETLSDHLEAQALWQQACQTQVDARYRLYLSHVAYQKAAGKLRAK